MQLTQCNIFFIKKWKVTYISLKLINIYIFLQSYKNSLTFTVNYSLYPAKSVHIKVTELIEMLNN